MGQPYHLSTLTNTFEKILVPPGAALSNACVASSRVRSGATGKLVCGVSWKIGRESPRTWLSIWGLAVANRPFILYFSWFDRLQTLLTLEGLRLPGWPVLGDCKQLAPTGAQSAPLLSSTLPPPFPALVTGTAPTPWSPLK